jgi:hypothetical protein
MALEAVEIPVIVRRKAKRDNVEGATSGKEIQEKGKGKATGGKGKAKAKSPTPWYDQDVIFE